MAKITIDIKTFTLLPKGTNCFTTQSGRLMAKTAVVTLKIKQEISFSPPTEVADEKFFLTLVHVE